MNGWWNLSLTLKQISTSNLRESLTIKNEHKVRQCFISRQDHTEQYTIVLFSGTWSRHKETLAWELILGALPREHFFAENIQLADLQR